MTFFFPLLKKNLPSLLLGLFLVSGCNHLPDWLGTDEEDLKLPGERISLKRAPERFLSEVMGTEARINLPEPVTNKNWSQPMGTAAGVADHLALTANIERATSATVGDGNDFSTRLIPSPVVTEQAVYAMDGEGVISAHQLGTLELIWQSSILESEEGDPLLGGGLAVRSNVLYASNNEGKVVALDTTSGEMKWQRQLSLPLRAAPRILSDTIVIQSADNQLLALDAKTGRSLWEHQGLNDQASLLQATLPAAGGDRVLATYSSGEVTMLSLQKGEVLWSDMLAGSAQTALQEERFGHLSTLMTPRVSFAGSAKSFTAYSTADGRRIWERRMPLLQSPWLAGTTLYVLTTDRQLMALNGANGRIYWLQELPETDGGEPVLWQNPVVAANTVWMVGDHGKVYTFEAANGNPILTFEIADGVRAAPVIVQNTLYLLDQHATLYALK